MGRGTGRVKAREDERREGEAGEKKGTRKKFDTPGSANFSRNPWMVEPGDERL